MAFEQILSVSGKSGLFRLVGQMKNGIIVESIEDGKRFPVHGAAKVSALEEISIYTDDEEVPLREVFKKMHEKEGGKQALDPKEGKDKIEAYFKEVLPDYDRDRVYVSDMVKVVKWYNELIEHDAFDPNEKSESEDSEKEDAKVDSKDEVIDKKKASPKKASTKANAAKPKSTGKAASKSKGGAGAKKSSGSQRGN